MTSTISSTNKKNSFCALMKWSLLKSLPITVIYSFLLFLFFPVLMYAFQVNKGLKLNMLEGFFISLIPLLVGLFTVITGNSMFSSYQNKRSTDLYSSFPVNKRTLFLSKYVTGLLIIIVPLVVMAFLGALVPALTSIEYDMGTFMTYIMQKVLTIIVGAVASYSLFAFLSMCCGTSADTVISYLVINLAYPVTISLLSGLFVSIVPGFSYMSSLMFYVPAVVVTALSPVVGTFLCGGLDLFISSTQVDSAAYYLTESINTTEYIIYWLVFIAVFFVASLILSQIRKNENVQNGFIFKAPMNVIKLLTSISGGVLFGTIFIATFDIQIGDSGFVQLIYFMIGALIGSMFAFLILTFIYNRGIAGFLKSLPNFLIAFAIVAVSYIVISLGFFSKDTYVPNADDVAAVSVSTDVVMTDEEWEGEATYSWYYDENKEKVKMDYFMEDSEVINNTIAMHQNIVDNLHEKNDTFYLSKNEDTPIGAKTPETILISYKMKDGTIIKRSYNNNQYDNEQAKNDFDKIASSDAYKEQYFILGKCDIDKVSLVSISQVKYMPSDGALFNEAYLEMDDEGTIIEELLEALEKDFKADKSYMDTLDSKVISETSSLEVDFFGTTEVTTTDSYYDDVVIDIAYQNYLEGDITDYIGTMDYHMIYGITDEQYVIPKDKYVNTWKVIEKYGLDVGESSEHHRININNN